MEYCYNRIECIKQFQKMNQAIDDEMLYQKNKRSKHKKKYKKRHKSKLLS